VVGDIQVIIIGFINIMDNYNWAMVIINYTPKLLIINMKEYIKNFPGHYYFNSYPFHINYYLDILFVCYIIS